MYLKKISKHGYRGPTLNSKFLKTYFFDSKDSFNLWIERVKSLNKLYLPITEYTDILDNFLGIFSNYSNLQLLNFISSSPYIKIYDYQPYSIIPKNETKEWFRQIIKSNKGPN